MKCREIPLTEERPMSSPELAAGRAVAYLRVSTREQAQRGGETEGFSIPAQRDACRRTAESLQAAVIDEYVDAGESARSSDRPALQAMLQRLRMANDVDYVIVHKVDRLARSREDDVSIAMDIRAAGARLVSATENIDESPSGRLMHGIMATIAEFYSQNLGAEARKGMTQKAKLGGTPGRAPIGYRNTRVDVEGREVRTVVVDEERAEHIRWAFQAFTTGEHTVTSIAEELEHRGLRCRATAKQPERPLSRTRVHKMLRNPYYVGIVAWNGVEYPGRHEPLVSRLTWDRVQAVLDNRSLGKERPMKQVHYLKGLLRCSRCESRLGISLNRGQGGQHYPYYFCLGRQRQNGCDLPYLPIERVELAVERHWRKVTVSDERLAGIRSYVVELIDATTAEGREERGRQSRRLEALEREETKLLQAHYADAVSMPVLQKEQSRIAAERSVASIRLQSVITETETLEMNLAFALGKLDRCDEFYLAGGPAARRELAFGLFEAMYIDVDRVVAVDLASPFVHLLDDELPKRVAERIRALGSSVEEAEDEPVAAPRKRKNSDLCLRGRSSNESLLVGLRGFEPPTSASRTQRSTKLSHNPLSGWQ